MKRHGWLAFAVMAIIAALWTSPVFADGLFGFGHKRDSRRDDRQQSRNDLRSLFTSHGPRPTTHGSNHLRPVPNRPRPVPMEVHTFPVGPHGSFSYVRPREQYRPRPYTYRPHYPEPVVRPVPVRRYDYYPVPRPVPVPVPVYREPSCYDRRAAAATIDAIIAQREAMAENAARQRLSSSFRSREEVVTAFRLRFGSQYENYFSSEPAMRPDWVPTRTVYRGTEVFIDFSTANHGYGFWSPQLGEANIWIRYDVWSDDAVVDRLLRSHNYLYQ